eukprot:CAMPEP_0177338724 /NCGR_PEP_ID=MMETSP0368-20130122/25017_1 /TAXON_ID=447022 ORGANISM="Scrippsiella hangoei-like, Strain SHHI-4" /NCGR_SAMPLE_ID=MMETSP0368 /ASSEMBLY_ACC=CAM_ASM_000363 /LENGTH=154 /DNA_ID=CAMNT_0018799753 /DNA_START=123 /DNA_END=583 /DNA_ORIENTATION=+
MAFSIVEPNSAGLCVTWTPAASSALILSWAPPLPPAMMAPAWPMRRPGGAVRPAMKETTGLLVLLLAFSHSAASSSAASANLTYHDDAFCRRVVNEALEAIDEVGAIEGVAANADASGLSEAGLRGLVDRLVCESAGPADDANLARHVDVARHD